MTFWSGDDRHAVISRPEGPTAASPSAVPETRWEWHARFPELAQFLGGWFSQDMPDEFPHHDAALASGWLAHLARALS